MRRALALLLIATFLAPAAQARDASRLEMLRARRSALNELRASGSRVMTVFPDGDSEHLFGANAMNPELRPLAAQAGYGQGAALVEQIRQFWG